MANNTYTTTGGAALANMVIKGPYSSSAYAKAYGTTGLVTSPKGTQSGTELFWSCQIKANQSTYGYAVLCEFSDILDPAGPPKWMWVGNVLTPVKSSVLTTFVWSRSFYDTVYTNVVTKCHIADATSTIALTSSTANVYVVGGTNTFGANTFSVAATTVTNPVTTTGTTKYEVVVGDGTNVVPVGNYDVYVPSAFTISGIVVVGDGNLGSSTVTVKQGSYSSFSSGTVPATAIGTVTLSNVRVGAASSMSNASVAAGSVLRIANTVAIGFKRMCVAVYGS
jgi:hypothetical protein